MIWVTVISRSRCMLFPKFEHLQDSRENSRMRAVYFIVLISTFFVMDSLLDGTDPRKFPRYADTAMKREADVAAKAIEYDATVERRQQDWLRKNGIK